MLIPRAALVISSAAAAGVIGLMLLERPLLLERQQETRPVGREIAAACERVKPVSGRLMREWLGNTARADIAAVVPAVSDCVIIHRAEVAAMREQLDRSWDILNTGIDR